MSVFCHRAKGVLHTKITDDNTRVSGQMGGNFHGMVQCYRQMLHIVVMLHCNFVDIVTSSQKVLIT